VSADFAPAAMALRSWFSMACARTQFFEMNVLFEIALLVDAQRNQKMTDFARQPARAFNQSFVDEQAATDSRSYENSERAFGALRRAARDFARHTDVNVVAY
jgi:hypothetical protein